MNKFLAKFKKHNIKEDLIQWLGIILIIIFFSIIIFYSNRNGLNNIKEKRLYTVGIISGFSRTKTTKSVKYIISYSGKTLEGKSSININKYSIGDRVLVVYNPNTNINILLPYFIDDSIKEPHDGWSKPPINNITDSEIIKYLEEKY